MKIGIVGARKYQDQKSVIDLVMALPAKATMITSSCKGVCTWAKEVAEEIRINSLEEAAEEGWEPYFYDGETEYELACPGCAETFLYEGEHGEMEVKEQFRGKINFQDNQNRKEPSEHLLIGLAVAERDRGLN